jgi:5-methylcytosine-specific restriction endonuclease McrA
MPGDRFYASKEWRRLRTARLQIDRYRCVVCGYPAEIVDHILSRKAGGANEIENLRSFCRSCDNQVKERGGDGARRSGGKPRAIGCGADGWPLDPEKVGG